jgi:hypothetical protein
MASASEGTRASVYRTAAGAEIDLVLEIRSGSPWAIEVKRSVGSPNPSKGFHIGSDDLGARRRFVVYPGTERFQFYAKTEVLPLIEDDCGTSGGKSFRGRPRYGAWKDRPAKVTTLSSSMFHCS